MAAQVTSAFFFLRSNKKEEDKITAEECSSAWRLFLNTARHYLFIALHTLLV